MDRFFRVDETGLTLHIPALPDDPSALLWLIGFALLLFALLAALHARPRVARAGERVRRIYRLWSAPRVDYSLHRLRHYTGTLPEWFQHFVLFTNYQFYIDEFIRLGQAEMANPHSEYIAFVEPGNVITHRCGRPSVRSEVQGNAPPRLPQMPAYHLVRADGSGTSMVNIGVGPANAKTITDHIAVLRPHAWIMLGHCAGLRNSQQLGDYVLAHAYVREDHVLDEELPLWVPIPALAEIQVALEQAVADVTQMGRDELKRIMRTGTVASTDNRNWSLLLHPSGLVTVAVYMPASSTESVWLVELSFQR